MAREQAPDPFGGEYAAVSTPDAWHVLSLLCFLAALGARFFIAIMPDDLRLYFHRPVLTALLVPAFAVVGILFGLLGLRKLETRSAARLALALNGVVLLLSAAAFAAFFYILPD